VLLFFSDRTSSLDVINEHQLADPVISGFVTASAILVANSQVGWAWSLSCFFSKFSNFAFDVTD